MPPRSTREADARANAACARTSFVPSAAVHVAARGVLYMSASSPKPVPAPKVPIFISVAVPGGVSETAMLPLSIT